MLVAGIILAAGNKVPNVDFAVLTFAVCNGDDVLIATWLFAQYGSAYAVAFYILFCAVLTLVATSMMTDYTGKDIEGEYE